MIRSLAVCSRKTVDFIQSTCSFARCRLDSYAGASDRQVRHTAAADGILSRDSGARENRSRNKGCGYRK